MKIDDYIRLKDLQDFDLSYFSSDEKIDLYLSRLGIGKDNPKFSKMKKFIYEFLNSSISIKTMQSVFKVVAIENWNKYKNFNLDIYFNNFNKTVATLKKYDDFDKAFSNLKYIELFKEKMDKANYDLFCDALFKLHYKFHNKDNDFKVELNFISTSLSLFGAKAKEDYIKEYVSNLTNKYKCFFDIKTDNDKIKEKLVIKKQRDKLRDMYINKELDGAIKDIVEKNAYSGLSHNEIESIIDKIIVKNISKCDEFVKMPDDMADYIRYEEVLKIINRLNSNYINYDSKEVYKYRDLITNNNGKYEYCGIKFSDKKILEFKNYKYLEYVFNKIRRDIAIFSKGLDVCLSNEEINSLNSDFSFDDDYYALNDVKFKSSKLMLFTEIVDFLAKSDFSYLDDKKFLSFFVDSGLFGFTLLNSSNISTLNEDSYFADVFINAINVFSLVEVMSFYDKISVVIGKDEFNLDNLYNILKIKDAFKNATLSELCMIGSDNLAKIAYKSEYTASSRKQRINAACDLVSKMYKKNKSTVPYVSGSVADYNYSMYDVVDNSVLTCGIDISTCLRLTGTDSDLFQYSILNKNGFILKITNKDNKLIGRAAGFRHGNGVYINQFVTIYNKINAFNCVEKDDILKAFYKACEDIVLTSQRSDEKVKIDFVIANKTLPLYDFNSSLDDDVFDYVVPRCLDNKNPNWFEFVNNANNLNSYKNNKIKIDFGVSNLVCVYSCIGDITKDKINFCDVKAIYKRKRNDVKVLSASSDNEAYVNRIRAIDSYTSKNRFDYLKLHDNDMVIRGDNWYIVYDNNKVIDGLFLCGDDEAEAEYIDNYENLDYLFRKKYKKKKK